MEWAPSVELPMGNNKTFLPVACSKVKVTGILEIMSKLTFCFPCHPEDDRELTFHPHG